MMYSMKKEKVNRRSPKKNIAFYISLAVCIAAVAGAAWMTYGSTMEYTGAAENNTEIQLPQVSEEPEIKTEKKPAAVSSKTKSDDDVIRESSTVKKADESPVPERVRAVAAEVEEQKSCKPTSGDIIKPYSPLVPLLSATMNDYRTHSGVDYSAEEGSPVKAVMNGKVKKIYTDAMLGNIICIEHSGGYEAFYCGLTDTPSVSEGDIVELGQTIGFVGKIPSESRDESHLHLEMKNSKGYIDPTGVI